MELIICLPQSTSFDIELDNKSVHSKYENITKSFFLKKGKHTLFIHDQAPTPSFWLKIVNFFNPINDTIGDLSTEINFTTSEDITISFNIVYGDFIRVDITPSDSLSQIIQYLD